MYTINLQFNKIKISVSITAGAAADLRKWDIERHSNLLYELHVALDGSFVVDVEKNQHEITRGKALLIPPGKYHSVCRLSDDYSHFVISFQVSGDDVSVSNLNERIGNCICINLNDFDMEIFYKIIDETLNAKIFSKEALYAMYSLVFTFLLRNPALYSEEKSEDVTMIFDDRFSLIDNFFEQNLSDNCTEDDLSRELNLSKRQLNRILMMNYGMGFREKLQNSRMDRAQWLLRTTNLSVSEICERIGYNSEASFFKAFKKHNNITPGKYRELYM